MRRADAIPILQPNKLEFPHPAAVQLDGEYCGAVWLLPVLPLQHCYDNTSSTHP